ncbi:MAG: M48 family metalloprotease [Cyclobacteriaceae bacterium]
MNNWTKIRTSLLVMTLALLSVTISCKKDDGPCSDLGKVGGLLQDLAFPVSNDVALGLEVANSVNEQFANDILPEAGNEAAYAYLNAMVDDILSSEDILYKDEFAWELTIIDQDVLNAFATPGGYIYVYTGLINYLENADDLAGVMGHEIAHADRRHSVNQLIKSQGISVLASIVLGQEASTVKEIAIGLAANAASLSFSREDEADADAASVEYLDETSFACNGAAEFFRKLEAEGGSGVPEFLSTHPDPSNRVSDIDARAACRSCSTENSTAKINGLTYTEFKALF